jgi:uncharacterized protein (TIGR02246 family)
MRRFTGGLLLSAVLLSSPVRSIAQTEKSAITSVLERSAAAWNHGDIDAFATSYKDSPDILFIGRTVRRGYAQMLAGYKAAYPSQTAMGKLSFVHLEVQPLDARFATVTGHFHLQRSVKGGGDADGFFLLVMENTPKGWKIVRDDTTVLAPPAM